MRAQSKGIEGWISRGPAKTKTKALRCRRALARSSGSRRALRAATLARGAPRKRVSQEGSHDSLWASGQESGPGTILLQSQNTDIRDDHRCLPSSFSRVLCVLLSFSLRPCQPPLSPPPSTRCRCAPCVPPPESHPAAPHARPLRVSQCGGTGACARPPPGLWPEKETPRESALRRQKKSVVDEISFLKSQRNHLVLLDVVPAPRALVDVRRDIFLFDQNLIPRSTSQKKKKKQPPSVARRAPFWPLPRKPAPAETLTT